MWNLLIADDERHIREGLKDIIEDMALPLNVVAVVANGQEVLNQFSENKIDLMILDICMPKLSGLDLIQCLREKEPEDMPLEIIILSGFDEFGFAKRALSLRVSAYLLKPVDENELFDAIQRAIKRLKEMHRKNEYIFTLKRYLGYENAQSKTFSDLVTAALRQVEEHFSEVDWDLHAAAQTLSCHPDYLSRKLKQETQYSFKEHLIAMRLQASLDLLSTNRYSITEIAWRVGYSNVQYFSTVFKSYFSCTPKAFQQLAATRTETLMN